MGYYSEMVIEREETSLRFDDQNHIDNAWWTQQDAEMLQKEIEEIELLAEIVEYRTQGYM